MTVWLFLLNEIIMQSQGFLIFKEHRHAPEFHSNTAGVPFQIPPCLLWIPETMDSGNNFLKIQEHQWFCCNKMKKEICK